MPRHLCVTQLKRNLDEILNRVAYRGARFVLTWGGTPIAELGPVPSGRTLGELGAVLESLPRLAPKDAALFAEDLAAGRSYLGGEELRDPRTP